MYFKKEWVVSMLVSFTEYTWASSCTLALSICSDGYNRRFFLGSDFFRWLIWCILTIAECSCFHDILENFRCIFGYSGKLKVSTTCATHSKNSWAAFCIVTISNFYICYSTIPRMRSNNFSAVASVFSSKKQSIKYFFPIQHA